MFSLVSMLFLSSVGGGGGDGNSYSHSRNSLLCDLFGCCSTYVCKLHSKHNIVVHAKHQIYTDKFYMYEQRAKSLCAYSCYVQCIFAARTRLLHCEHFAYVSLLPIRLVSTFSASFFVFDRLVVLSRTSFSIVCMCVCSCVRTLLARNGNGVKMLMISRHTRRYKFDDDIVCCISFASRWRTRADFSA